jgi:hypothetical protein
MSLRFREPETKRRKDSIPAKDYIGINQYSGLNRYEEMIRVI